MKRKTGLIILGLLIGLNVFSQTFYHKECTFYTKFITETSEGEQIWFVKDDLTYQRVDDDTTFYFLSRETIFKKQNNDLPLYNLYVLELNNKVILRGQIAGINYFGEGATVFDFSLDKGDTVSFIDPTLSKMPIKQYVIDSIGYKTFSDNSKRKTQYIRPLFKYKGPEIFISEGIGPSNGLLGFIDEMLLLGLKNGYSELISACFDADIRYINSDYSHIDSESCNSDSFKTRILLHSIKPQLMDDIVIYPNPATNILYLDNLTFDELYIFTFEGRQIGHHYSPKNEISIDNLSKGLYFIQSLHNNHWSTFRFIKR